ncbi:MAG: signal peptidase I [Candidatus Pelethousia sp.]|nr:signal peptidase I [Candidatus Pelethousia sp.]
MQQRALGRLRGAMVAASEELHKRDEVFKRASNLDFFMWLAVFVAMALAIRLFVFEPVQVVGDSMYPTLLDGERMFVQKVGYLIDPPERGDVIICRYPAYMENCVKRVIGLPGDTVSVSGGIVYVNGEPLEESAYWHGDSFGDDIRVDVAPVTVPEKSVFVMGDNRNFSTDSRELSIGPIPYARIIGKVHGVMFPLGEVRSVYTGVSPMAGVPYTPPATFYWGQ